MLLLHNGLEFRVFCGQLVDLLDTRSVPDPIGNGQDNQGAQQIDDQGCGSGKEVSRRHLQHQQGKENRGALQHVEQQQHACGAERIMWGVR